MAGAARTRLGGGVETGPLESALLLRCPAAEPAVGAARARLDRAAAVGVPAHVTVGYPFRPVARLSAADHERLESLVAAAPSFTLTGSRTAWFGESVVYVAVEDPAPVIRLVDAVTRAFPEHPPYGGAFAEVVPHLTIGHDHAFDVLRAAEAQVAARLPFAQAVHEVELWCGPALASGRGPWRRVRSYRLG